MKVSSNKPFSIHLRLTQSQFEYLKLLSDMSNLSISDIIRMFIDSKRCAGNDLKSSSS